MAIDKTKTADNNTAKVAEIDDLAPMEKEVAQEDVELFWKKYANTQKNEGRQSLYSEMLASVPKLEDYNRILFTTSHACSQLDEVLQKLLYYLRKNLENTKLTIKIEVKQGNADVPAWTPAAKYKEMAEKNPALKKLKDKLGLDFKF